MRILVVEDEFIIAQDISWVIENEVGFTVAEAVTTVEDALRAIEVNLVDAAVLDASLDGVTTEPVAAALDERRLPYFVVSGAAGAESLPGRLRSAPFLRKPYGENELVERLKALA